MSCVSLGFFCFYYFSGTPFCTVFSIIHPYFSIVMAPPSYLSFPLIFSWFCSFPVIVLFILLCPCYEILRDILCYVAFYCVVKWNLCTLSRGFFPSSGTWEFFLVFLESQLGLGQELYHSKTTTKRLLWKNDLNFVLFKNTYLIIIQCCVL